MFQNQEPKAALRTRRLMPGFRAALAVAFIGAALVSPTAASRGPATPRSVENPAALIYAGWFGNTIPTPSFIAANHAFLESQPFDGLVVYLRKSSINVNLTLDVMKNAAISYDTMMTVLGPIAGLDFTNLKHNVGLIMGSTPPDFFDDWSVVIQNYANMARAARDSGLKGLCFDNEQYHSPWGNYGSQTKYVATKSLAEYEVQARLRGKQVMEAMVAEFPDIVFMTLHGPYVSEPEAPSALKFPQWQSSNELLGPFFAGNLEGAGSTACSMDGGELYSLRTEDDFRNSYAWRRNDLPSDEVDCRFIPASLRSVWPTRTSISFGVYDVAFGGASMNATILRSTLANSMRQADRYVWFYAEASTYLLPSNAGGASASWVDAIRQARADVAATAGSAAPTNLTATAVSPFAIDLAWEDNSSIETGFLIDRKTVINGAWAQVATAPANTVYLRNGSLWSGTGYVYRIRAVGESGASAYTSEATATTHLVVQPPAAPSNLIAAAVSPFTIVLDWRDNSSNESSFEIDRRTVNGTWATVANAEAGSTTFRNGSLWSGTGYVYRIRAVNATGASASSGEATATTPLVEEVLAAPTGLSATVHSNYSVNLGWTDNSSNETGFAIERRRSGGLWSQVTTVGAGVTTFRDGGRTQQITYVYRVRAFNGSGHSMYTADARVTMP